MDFDISNILYVVITIIAVVVGLLGKKKKPANTGSEEPESERQPGFMENLERVLRMGQEDQGIVDLQDSELDLLPEEVEADVIVEPFTDLSHPSRSIMEDYDRIMSSNTDGDEADIFTFGDSDSEQMEILDLDKQDDADYFEITRNFDAKTAVIYAAIINRTEY